MAPAASEGGRRLALVIATQRYNDATLRQLRSPGQDALGLTDVLADPAIGGFEVMPVVDAPAEKIRREIVRFCVNARPLDLVLVYLSCHGVLDDRGRLYYATTDTERELLTATAVRADWLNEQLDDSLPRSQVMVLDCCHSGAFAKGVKSDGALALEERFAGRGRIVFTASRATEYAFEGTEAVGEGLMSVFTSAIIKGLKSGDADIDRDGLVTVSDLYNYVYDEVRSTGSPQTPMLWTYGVEGRLVLARSPRAAVVTPRLPEHLRVALESPAARIREGAVHEVAALLTAGDPSTALAARETLEAVASTDLPSVATLARSALADDTDAAPEATRAPAPEEREPPRGDASLAAPKPSGVARTTVMRAGHRRLLAVLTVLALAGIAAGFALSPFGDSAHAAIHLTVSAANESIDVSMPANWRRQTAAVNSPGLQLESPLVIAATPPGGRLLIGSASVDGGYLLPRELLSMLPAAPGRQIVHLAGKTLYRYLGLRPRGADATENVYAVPTTGGALLAVCFLPAHASSSIAVECERIVASVKLTTGRILPLAPDGEYAASIGRATAHLGSLSAKAVTALNSASDARAQARAAGELAQIYERAAQAARRTAPGPAEAAANTALAASLEKIDDGYAELVRDAQNGLNAEAARRSIDAGYASFEDAYAQLGALGYQISQAM